MIGDSHMSQLWGHHVDPTYNFNMRTHWTLWHAKEPDMYSEQRLGQHGEVLTSRTYNSAL